MPAPARKFNGNLTLIPNTNVESQLETIYREELGYVLNTLRRLAIPERYLEDVAHDVFLVVHRKLVDFDPSRPLRPWLFGISYRVSLDFKRRGSNARELPSLPEVSKRTDSNSDPQRSAERNQRQAMLIEALADLKPIHRAVFVLHEIEECEPKEVAQTLEVPLNTVYSRLRAARKSVERSLRRKLRNQEEMSCV